MSTKTNKHFDIVIVGGGLVGAALACALQNTRFKIALVEANTLLSGEANCDQEKSRSNVKDFSARVSALTAGSRALLESLGVWEQISESAAQAYTKMEVWDELGTQRVNFDAEDIHAESLGWILENDSILQPLHACLLEQENLTLFTECSLKRLDQSANSAQLTLSNEEVIDGSLVVAADGPTSSTRRMAGFTTREWDYQQKAIVTTVQTAKSHDLCARQCFSEAGPVAFLPLKDDEDSGQFCSIVWSLDYDEAKSILSLDENEFNTALSRSISEELGEVVASSPRFSFPLRQRHAKDYVKGNCIVIGDAAHAIHPLAGQGVNLGFKDVQVLSEILIDASTKDIEPNHTVLLKRYQRARRHDNLMMMGVMEGFKRLFGNKDPIVRLVRNTGLKIFDEAKPLKNLISKLALN